MNGHLAVIGFALIAASMLAYHVGRILGGASRPQEKPKSCTGYSNMNIMLTCNGLRSDECQDGRCHYHCRTMCKCGGEL
jgi:hypothetical protein